MRDGVKRQSTRKSSSWIPQPFGHDSMCHFMKDHRKQQNDDKNKNFHTGLTPLEVNQIGQLLTGLTKSADYAKLFWYINCITYEKMSDLWQRLPQYFYSISLDA